MNASELPEEIRAWLEVAHDEPQSFVAIATRLYADPNITPAWRELAKRGISGMRAAKMAWGAYVKTADELRHLLPSAEEEKRLQEVESLTQELIKAIDRAPLLDTCSSIQIDGKTTEFAWRADGKQVAKNLYPSKQIIELRELLEYAMLSTAQLRKHKLARSVKRWRDDPEAACFIRYLAARLEEVCGEKLMGTVALIASAALGRGDDPITKQQVQSVLRG